MLCVHSFLLILLQLSLRADLSQSSIKIIGNSTIHEWTSVVEEYDISGQVKEGSISDLKVAVSTPGIKSGKGIMDNKTYTALRADDYPTIHLTAPNLNVAESKIQGTGTLTVADQSRTISILGDVKSLNANQSAVSGELTLLMSDFGITPPTAMFGSLKTSDTVRVQFNIVLENSF